MRQPISKDVADTASPGIRTWIVPAYVFACLLIGGSPQGVGFAMALQLGAIALLGWAVSVERAATPVRGERALWVLCGLAMVLVIAQLIPLPPSIWTRLPWRSAIAEGDALLGLGAVWRPWSLSPDQTIATALAMVPPMAVAVAMIRARAFRANLLILAILGATALSILLGIKQRGDSQGLWNFYPIGNFGVATGTFANANFFGALLLASIPLSFAMGIARADRAGDGNRQWTAALPVLPLLLLIALGMLLNGSLAVAMLSVPVALLSLTLLFRAGTIRIGRLAVVATVVLLAGTGALVVLGAAQGDPTNAASFDERRLILHESLALAAQVFPVGTGLGTFPTVYTIAQEPASVSRFVVNHAHNDYVELAIEMGLAAILLASAFLGWFLVQAARVWRSAVSDVHARAGTIVAGTLLVHSLVDYPLRTSAMAAVFAVGIGLMLVGDGHVSRWAPKVRHLRLD
jgi:O-antigen ligase